MKLTKSKLNFIVIFIFIYLRFSLWFLSISEAITAVLAATFLVGYQLLTTRKFNLKYKYTIVALTMCGFALMSCIVNLSFGVLDMSVFIQWLLALLIVSAMTQDEFSTTYIKVISILAVFSIVGFICVVFFPALVAKFPYITTTKWVGDAVSRNIRNMFICIGAIGANNKRNWGIFYEPGMFAFHLNMAIFLMLFVCKRPDIKKIVVLTIAQITTTSTNGYASIALIFITYFLQHRNSRIIAGEMSRRNDKKIKRWIWEFAILAVIAVTVFFVRNPERWGFFISKISQLNSSSTEGSGYERIEALRVAITCIIDNPILGVSVTRVSAISKGAITTFTPLQWFANYGLVYGLVCNIFYCMIGHNELDSCLTNILKAISLFTMVVSQNMTSNSIVLVMILYTSCKYLCFQRREYKKCCQ